MHLLFDPHRNHRDAFDDPPFRAVGLELAGDDLDRRLFGTVHARLALAFEEPQRLYGGFRPAFTTAALDRLQRLLHRVRHVRLLQIRPRRTAAWSGSTDARHGTRNTRAGPPA